jgi:hypothetical protein
MVALLDLWLPIVLSAVFVFVASSVIHMATPMHKKDFRGLPDEAGVLAALRERGLAPGSYMFPHCSSMKEMSTPEFDARMKQGPVGTMTIRPSGSVRMGPSLAQWFVLSLVVVVFAGYVAGRALAPGADPGRVMQIASAVAFAGFGLAQVNESIWKGVAWGTTARFLVDALVTGATFRWLWP